MATPALRSSAGVSHRSRSTDRHLTAVAAGADLQIASVQSVAHVGAARIQAAMQLGQQAEFAVAFLSDTEQRLAHLCPMATTRLAAIADLASMQVAQLLADAGQDLRS